MDTFSSLNNNGSTRVHTLHTKFSGHRFTGSVEEDFLNDFTIYRRGDHIGHVTWMV